MKSNNPTYTIDITPVGDHLQVIVKELAITVETEPGKTSRDDALDLAHEAIERYHLAMKREHAKAG